MDNENELFTQFLREKAAEAERELRYRPNYFIGMLGAEGGYRTAYKLLSASAISEGFTKLWENGRVYLTVEALVVESEWRQYFNEMLLERAEKTLRKVDYPFKRYESRGESTGELGWLRLIK